MQKSAVMPSLGSQAISSRNNDRETYHKIRIENSRHLEGKGNQELKRFAHIPHGHHSYSSKHRLEIVR